MRKGEREKMGTELEADEESRESSAFFRASLEMLRGGGEVSAASSRQNGAVVVCGGLWYLNAIADLITSLALGKLFAAF